MNYPYIQIRSWDFCPYKIGTVWIAILCRGANANDALWINKEGIPITYNGNHEDNVVFKSERETIGNVKKSFRLKTKEKDPNRFVIDSYFYSFEKK